MAEIFKAYVFEEDGTSGDIVENLKQTVSSGMWSGGATTLTAFYTFSTQSGSSGDYFYDVYKTDPATDTNAEVQFSVAYGHDGGSGSKGGIGLATGNRATAAVYNQFGNVMLGPTDDKFTFAGPYDSDDIYVLSFRRSRFRERIDPGQWELHLSSSAGTVKLIDNSSKADLSSVDIGGRVYDVVSGSISSGTAVINTAAAAHAGGGYGLFYPDMGAIILHPAPLNASGSTGQLNLGTVSSSDTNNNNAGRMFNDIVRGVSFRARRQENISSTHYFCRVHNRDFNFSNNPTFFTSSDGSLTQQTFERDPKVYISTVGLYNDTNELLAVAKLSKPILKSFAREAIVKVKLDF